MKTVNKLFLSRTGDAQGFNTDSLPLEFMTFYAIRAAWTNEAPTAKGFVDADVTVGTDTIAEAAHGYSTGLVGQLTTTGVLPAGLAAATNYFIISVTAGTYKFASSLANAIAGTAVDITAAAGGGTHTFTPTAVSGTVKLQASIDPVSTADASSSWEDVASSSTNITATGSTQWEKADVAYTKVRLAFTMAAGQIATSARFNAKGYSTGG